MQDDSISPDAEDQAEGSEDNMIYVKLDTLAVQGQPPAEGDEVDLQVKGKVSSIDGDVACVTAETANGQPVEEGPEDDNKSESLEDEGKRLGAQASASDQSSYQA